MTTEHERPQAGGSYRRNEDGSLTRIAAGEPAAPIAEIPAAAKPSRRAATQSNRDKS